MNELWRLFVSPALPGPDNMALDEAVLQAQSQGAPPTIRFYLWSGSWVSIGRFQRAREDLDLDACAARRVKVVRRPTGGKAILHHAEALTYSVAMPADHPLVGGGVMASYRSINQALVAGLALLGVAAAMRDRPPLWPDTGAGMTCFETAYRHEVYWAGRKLIASAQRREGAGLLQQGIIHMTESSADLARLVRLPPGRRATLARDLASRTGTLRQTLDREPSFHEVAEALAEGFRRAWGITLRAEEPSQSERESAESLVASRYSTDAWNLTP